MPGEERDDEVPHPRPGQAMIVAIQPFHGQLQ